MKIRHIGHEGQSIDISSPAKINLFFELLEKRSDGFHEIETVMSTVSLFDDLHVAKREDGAIRLQIDCQGCTGKEAIPTDERNLIVQAMQRIRSLHGRSTFGCDIVLRKRIPSAAGLGGASGNAAAAILAANAIWKLDLSAESLQRIASEIGSDVPFFFRGGTARCTGRGELIELINVPSGLPVVITKPPQGLSTAEVYRRCVVPQRPRNAASLISELKTGNWAGVGKNLYNRLEEFATPMTPAIGEQKEMFDRLDCLGHQMSGSGSSYFGIFRNTADAQRAAKIATRMDSNTVFACETYGGEVDFSSAVSTG